MKELMWLVATVVLAGGAMLVALTLAIRGAQPDPHDQEEP